MRGFVVPYWFSKVKVFTSLFRLRSDVIGSVRNPFLVHGFYSFRGFYRLKPPLNFEKFLFLTRRTTKNAYD